jgi:hypothetical protein
VNTIFKVLSNLLAIYIFISFFALTYVAVTNYWNNASGLFSPEWNEESLELENQNQEKFMKIFLIICITSTLGVITILAFFHLSIKNIILNKNII